MEVRMAEWDVVGGGPPVLEDVEADAAVGVHVGVEHLGDELDRRRLVGVLLGELWKEDDIQESEIILLL